MYRTKSLNLCSKRLNLKFNQFTHDQLKQNDRTTMKQKNKKSVEFISYNFHGDVIW